MVGRDLAREVTSERPFAWQNGAPKPIETAADRLDTGIWQDGSDRLRVVAFDYGIKYNILRNLERRGCDIVVVPARTPAETVGAMEPDGIFLSNGPGDPEPVAYAIEAIRKDAE